MIKDEDGFGLADVMTQASVSRETSERITTVVETLKEWSSELNLIGRNEWRHIWRRHVFDSAQILEHIPRDAEVVDLGTGAGFPGLIVASALSAEGIGKTHLIEKAAKKCVYLRAVVEAAKLNAEVHNQRAEEVEGVTTDIITARAFAPLPRLMSSASHLFGKDTLAVLHKGQNWKEELTAASKTWNFSSEAIPSRSGGSGVILKIWGVQRVS